MRVHPLDLIGKVFTFGGFILLIWTSSTFTHAVIKEHYFHPSVCVLDKVDYKLDTCQLDLQNDFSSSYYPMQYNCWHVYITSPSYLNRSILLTQTRLKFTDKMCFVSFKSTTRKGSQTSLLSFGNVAYNNLACNESSTMDARVMEVVNETLFGVSGVEYEFDEQLIQEHKTQYFSSDAHFPCFIQSEPYQAILVKQGELWHISLTFASLFVLFTGLGLLRVWGDGFFKTFAICLSDEIFSYLVILPYYVICMVFYLLFTALHYLLYNAKPRMSMERFWLEGGIFLPFIKLYKLLKNCCHSTPAPPDVVINQTAEVPIPEVEVTLPTRCDNVERDPPPKYEDVPDVSPPPSYNEVMRTVGP